MEIPVLLPNIFDHPFTYDSEEQANVGQYVLVPFGKINVIGVIWDQFEHRKYKKKFKIKKIIRVLKIPKIKGIDKHYRLSNKY